MSEAKGSHNRPNKYVSFIVIFLVKCLQVWNFECAELLKNDELLKSK